MRAKKVEIKKGKSIDKNKKNKTISTNKSKSLKTENSNKRKAKSKNKVINIKGIPNRNNPKIKNPIKKKNSTIENNKNNSINNNTFYHYLNNSENIYENIYNNNYNNNQMNNTMTLNFRNGASLNLLSNSFKNNENQNKLDISIDRLLNNTHNVLEKQNIILSECELFSENIAKSDYQIQKLNNNENNILYNNLLEKNTFSEIISKMKNNNINSELNMKLTNENNSLKHKLEMLNINNENNINELDTLKKVLVNEINQLLFFIDEIGYNNIPMKKIDIVNINSQKITYFFQIIKTLIKEMQGQLHNKETQISKITIEKKVDLNRNNYNLKEINKSCENLCLDYNNIGLKNYNFSVRDSIHNKISDISFRNNYQKNYQDNKNDDIISKTQRSLNMDNNESFKRNYFNRGINEYMKDDELNNHQLRNIRNNLNEEESDLNFYYQYKLNHQNKEIK